MPPSLKRHERSPPHADVVPASQRRRLSFSHSDLGNAQQVGELFEQCLDQVLRGLHPVSRETAIRLAAIHCHVQFGPHHAGVEHSIRAYQLLPKEYTHGKNVHSREHEKNIIEQYRNLSFADTVAAKRKYCEICRNLPTYGMIFFEVREPQGNKLIPRLFGVNKECVMSVDKKTKIVRKSWPLEQLRRWAAGPTTFNIDFGDYQDGYYSVQTLEGERIKRLIAEFVDIIIWKKKIVDPWGLEGDEGAIMIEDFVLRARSVPLSLGDVQPGEHAPPRVHAPKQQSIPAEFPEMAPPKPEWPRRTSAGAFGFPPPEQPPIAPIVPLPAPAKMPPGFEQYDQLPFQQRPPLATTQVPESPIRPQPPPVAYSPPSPPVPPAAPVTQSLPPSLTTSMHQNYLSPVSPASMSMLTEQEIVYEVSTKNGIEDHRSFEQYYSQTRNLQGLCSGIEQSARRVADCSAGLSRPIVPVALSEEQHLMAIQLGEDTIRHRAVVFLACTAQVIEWTSDYQPHPQYGHAQVALVQASDNLCELVQCFIELCALRQDVLPAAPLVSSLCNAFNDFLEKLHPERAEKRSTFLSSASLVGECAFALLNSLNDEEEAREDQHFYLVMNEAIQRVANGTANLVMQAKSIPALSAGDAQNERLIEAATIVALFTSELIALARVLASIMAHPACQKRIQAAVERVRVATAELLAQAKANAYAEFAASGTADHYAQMQRNALMAEVALQQLVEQTRA